MKKNSSSILVVSESMRLQLSNEMEKAGYSVIEASNPEEALAECESKHPDIVLLDVTMPVVEGFNYCKKFQTLSAQVLAIVAVDDKESVEQVFAAGAIDCITKPLDATVLRHRVRRILDSVQARATFTRAEAQLQAESERFHLLVDGVKDYAIFMLDPNGYCLSWNAGAERITGYKEEEIVGQHFSCFFPTEDILKGKPEHELKVATTQGRYEEESWRVRKDNSRYCASVIITALRDETGILRGFAKITRDITDQKIAEARMLQTLAKEKELAEIRSQFITTTSHEFRTPLAIILSSTELLESYSHKFTEKQKQDKLLKIKNAAKRMEEILDDVFIMNQAEAG